MRKCDALYLLSLNDAISCSNVTLIGHGHGAACVHLLMLSPMASSSLFSRVVLMSGSAMSPWAIARDSDTYARHLGKLLSCPTHDNVQMVECLRGKSVEDILSIELNGKRFAS